MVLAIDIGNTRTKAAVFEDNRLLEYLAFDRDAQEMHFQYFIIKFPEISDIVISSVRSEALDTRTFSDKNIHLVTTSWKFPFKNLYATPLTLGIDRMVLAAGAVLGYPSKNRLVIDVGTCITYDFIDQDNCYHGGAIAPGIKLRYEALHSYTAKLPLLERTVPDNYIGSSTEGSIHSGVVMGVVHEIDGFINQYLRDYPNFIIILTGGDGDFLAERLKNTIFANSNFLLESLNQTFQYKINND